MSDSVKYVTACRNAMRAVNDNPERAAAILDAVSRLSPVVRELLLSNPDAVERAVEAVMKASNYERIADGLKSPMKCWPVEAIDAYEERCESYDAAIAALNHGRDEG